MVGIDFPQQHDRMETNRDNVDGQSDLHCEGRGQTFKLFCQSRKAGVMFHDLLYVNAVCFVLLPPLETVTCWCSTLFLLNIKKKKRKKKEST